MASVTREDPVARQQLGAYPDRNRLLPDRKMNGAPHLLFRIQLGDSFLDKTNAQHLLIS